MKKLATGVALGAVGLIAALGVSIAGAAGTQTTFGEGFCTVHGTATFDPPLKNPPHPGDPAAPDTTYDFHTSGDPADSTCTGKLNGEDFSGPVTAYVKGTGQLFCSNSSATGGKGAVVFVKDGVTYTLPANLDVTGGATEVSLKLYDSESPPNTAAGHASFAAGAGPETLDACNGGGVGELEFDAEFGGPSTLKGPAAAPAPTSTGTTPQNTTPPPQTSAPQPAGEQQTEQPQPQGGVQGERAAGGKKPAKKKAKRRCAKAKKKAKKKSKNCAKKKSKKKKSRRK